VQDTSSSWDPDADRIGVQLYSIADLVDMDTAGALAAIARIGFGAVEVAGYGRGSPASFRAQLDECGLRVIAVHVALEALDDIQSLAADLLQLRCRQAVVAWLAPARYVTALESRRTAARLAEGARALQTAGFGLAYHNHDFEFARLGGTTLWEILQSETVGSGLTFEIDVHWVRAAGLDPARVIAEAGTRVTLIHAKDTGRPGEDRDCPVGDGIEDWSAVLGTARAVGVRWVIIEQERSRDMLADLERSLGFLRAALMRSSS
jgi:sugar phosphate isomerase/epimerase